MKPVTTSPSSRGLDRWTAAVATVASLALLALAIWPLSSPDAPETIQFLGRFHPILVHLPIGFLFALLVLELLDLLIKSAALHHATYVMAWLAAGAALVAVVAGILLAYPGNYSAELLFWHRWLGSLTAVCAIWLLAWKIGRTPRAPHGWSFLYHPLLVATAALLAGAGHYGGSLTHGSDYLTAYMPAGLRSILKLPEKTTAPVVEPVGNPEEMIVYTALVEPILRTNCMSCHGSERQRGGLRLDSHPFILAGGESGPDIDLIAKSLVLPLDDEQRMPPKEKPQLEPDEIALLTWWVQTGASPDGRVGDLSPTREISRILQNRFGADPDADAIPMREWEEIADLVQELNAETGANLRRIALDNAALEIEFLPAGVVFGDAEVERLIPIQANLQRLNLSRSSITDEGLKHLGGMMNLRRIDLSTTTISDDGLAHLSGLNRLSYINLYATSITDEGLRHLHGLANLRRIYLWQTNVTSEGVEQLQASLRDESQAEAWQAEIRELEQRLQSAEVEVALGGFDVSEEPVAEAGAEVSAEPETEAQPEAEPAPVEAPGETASAEPLAPCPITGRPADLAHTVTHGDQVIAFCCGDCVAKFKANPEAVLAGLDQEAAD